MELSDAMAWAGDRKTAVLITIRSDGRPQSSDITYVVDADDSVVISLTDGRAKTANIRRDPRVVLHITEPSSWSYLSLDGTIELTEVARSIDDETTDALVDYYERAAGKPHPDWADYRKSMVAEGRLLARFTPHAVVGQIH